MTADDPYPLCQGADPDPTPVTFAVPPGTIDCHAHIFGPESRYPYSPRRGYTPPDASLQTFLNLHRTLGGIERAVLTQPSVYGTDNSCMLDAVDTMGDRFRAIAAVDEDISDKELEDLHARGVRGVRVNLVDKGGMSFDGIDAVRRFTQRIKDFGWHLEVLIHVHEFEDLYATLNSMAVDVCVGHLGYMKTSHGLDHPGFQEFLNLVRHGRCWVKLSGSYRITTSDLPPYSDVKPLAQALIEANEDRILWGTDWPHPVFKGTMPNDGPLMDQLGTWAPDEKVRKKILVDNPSALYGF
ncbi:MAG: amidohydrolase family protein [Rhodospirillaceae bacterium]|nr:amidohydrolase family protein [Rhodospirillaceae bacterium]